MLGLCSGTSKPQKEVLAEKLWIKALKYQKIEKLDPEVYKMVKTIEEILPRDEITEFVKHHGAVLKGPDGDSSLSTTI